MLGLSVATVVMVTVLHAQRIPDFSVIFEQHLRMDGINTFRYWTALGSYQAVYGLFLLAYTVCLRRFSPRSKSYLPYVQFFYQGVLVYTAFYLCLSLFSYFNFPR